MLKKILSNKSIKNSLAIMLVISLIAGLFYPFLRAMGAETTEEEAKTQASYLLLSEGETIASNLENNRIYPAELNEWAFILYIMSRVGRPRVTPVPTATPSPEPTEGPEDAENTLPEESTEPEETQPEATPSPEPLPPITLNDMVVVPRLALENVKKLPYSVNVGLMEGDRVSLKTLIEMFVMTRADDVRETLVYYVALTNGIAVNGMNAMARNLGLKNTNYTGTDGAYNPNQYTTVADLKRLYDEPLKQPLFADTIEQESITVNFLRKGADTSLILVNSMYGDVLLYGEPLLPEGWQLRFRLSGASAGGGGAQLVLATNPEGQEVLSIIGGIPFEKDVSIESARLLELEADYCDAKQELPLGDDTVRYKYLLNSQVEYYTMNNRPLEYNSQAKTDRYMMNLTVKVWKMNEKDGSRYSSQMTIPIHRKLYQSLKEIMEEVYELPIQFPMKVFLGYGYRKSGGIGLSNCTLMSVHSYGAAVDINNGDYDNDYFLGKGNDLRDKTNPYCIPDEVIEIFEKHGWFWGGNFDIAADTMHFQYLGLDYLSYQGNAPFDYLSIKGSMDLGIRVGNLQDRLAELGYNVNRNGIYNNVTRTALMKFQARNGLPVTGDVDYKTWETLINLTHYMKVVF